MSSLSNDSQLASKRIDLVFSRFAAFYGHVWRSQFKSEGFLVFAKGEWAEGLRSFSEDVIQKAVISCRDFYEMPPTLPQVVRCCREQKRRMDVYVADDVLQPAKPEVISFQLNRCKDILNK